MSTIKLSNQHIADLNRRRRTVVNYDSQCHAPPFICEGVEPQQLVEFSFSLIDTGEHGIDAMWWCFGPGDEAAYPSKVLPTYKAAKYKKWIEAGVDIVRLYIEQTQKRGLEVFISWHMNGGPASALWTNKFIVDYPIAGDLDRDEMEPQKKAHPD